MLMLNKDLGLIANGHNLRWLIVLGFQMKTKKMKLSIRHSEFSSCLQLAPVSRKMALHFDFKLNQNQPLKVTDSFQWELVNKIMRCSTNTKKHYLEFATPKRGKASKPGYSCRQQVKTVSTRKVLLNHLIARVAKEVQTKRKTNRFTKICLLSSALEKISLRCSHNMKTSQIHF